MLRQHRLGVRAGEPGAERAHRERHPFRVARDGLELRQREQSLAEDLGGAPQPELAQVTERGQVGADGLDRCGGERFRVQHRAQRVEPLTQLPVEIFTAQRNRDRAEQAV
ncbi:hypothetical protein [Lentzea guizhouensis]|uniref:hypothetical protein n=1 Tax=Lentzea guizhouensis TaxID=1586287 RepID=UPI001F41413F|nr:hypothetical protein [Lentzea guizhouensis]